MEDVRNSMKHVRENLHHPLVGVEVGVQNGDNALVMLANMDIERLYLVDSYESYVYHPRSVSKERQDSYYRTMFRNMKNSFDKVVFITKPSLFASTLFGSCFFDFVYVDSNHLYEYVRDDIPAWIPKIKDDGFLCGHDYSSSHPGVKIAVDEFVSKNGKRLVTFSDSDWMMINA